MQQVKAFTLSHREPVQGIQVVFPSSERNRLLGANVSLGPAHGGPRLVYLGTGSRTSLPWCENGMLMAARPYSIPGDRHSRLVEIGDWVGIVIRVIAKNLDFGLQPLAEGLSFWSGCESLTIYPLARYGKPSEWRVRDELYALSEGESILVGDRYKGIMVLACINGELVMRPATREEVVAFVLGYASGTASRYQGAVSWSFDNLVALGAYSEASEIAGNSPNFLTRGQLVSLRRRHH